jgi:hypothetical protein
MRFPAFKVLTLTQVRTAEIHFVSVHFRNPLFEDVFPNFRRPAGVLTVNRVGLAGGDEANRDLKGKPTFFVQVAELQGFPG